MKKWICLLCVTLLALSAVQVSADSKVHTATLVPSVTTLAPGDAFTVDVVLDSTAGMMGFNYRILFDADVFAADTGKYADNANLSKYVNRDWLDAYNALSGGKSLGQFVFGFVNTINAAAIRTPAVSEENNTNDMVIGRFNLTVKANASSGDTVLTLTDTTTVDANERFGADMVFEPVTVTIAGGADEKIADFALLDVNGDAAVNPWDAVSLRQIRVESADGAAGNLFIAVYERVDKKDVLVGVKQVSVGADAYEDGTAAADADFAIAENASLIKALFTVSGNDPVVKTQRLRY